MSNFIEGKVVSVNPLEVKTEIGLLLPSNCLKPDVKIGDQLLVLIQTTGANLATRQGGINKINGVVSECVFRGDDFKVTISCYETIYVFSLSEHCEMGQSITIQVPDSSIVCLEE